DVWAAIDSVSGAGRRGTDVGRGDGVEQGTQPCGASAAEGCFKSCLRLGPARAGCSQPRRAGLGQTQYLAPSVAAARHDVDQSFALERQDIAAERGSIHDQGFGQGIDRHRSREPQPYQDRKLGGAQPARRQKLVVELRNVPTRLAQRQAIADLGPRASLGAHRRMVARFCAHMRLYGRASLAVNRAEMLLAARKRWEPTARLELTLISHQLV